VSVPVEVMEDVRVRKTILRYGLAHDLAFADTRVLFDPIRCNGRCPLGMYDTDTNIIYLAPIWSEATLLHELGHRHGHYYHDDISEGYAERWRKTLMAKDLLAEGGPGDTARMTEVSSLLRPGESGVFEVYYDRTVTREMLDEVYRAALEAGLDIGVLEGQDNILRMGFKAPRVAKFLPLAALVWVVGLGIGGVLAWGVYRITNTIADKAVSILVIGTGAVILYKVLSNLTERPMARAA